MSSEEEPGYALLAGRYEIGPAVGHGSTATVHRAHDRLSGEDVAVKLFTAGPSPADDGRDQREIDILTGLRHPGLVAFRDAGHGDGRLFVVMDLVEGQTLADAMRGGPLPADDVAALGAELAGALAHVHRNGVVHRDVKPANILLDAEGRPRLTDFGIAHLDGATRVTRTGLIVGTAAYMAPEQVRGRTVGTPTDVYALGLVLLEAVTGVREYPGAPVEAAVARLHRSPRVPRDLPPQLGSAIRRMTATAPADRPTAMAVAELLRGAPTSTPGSTARRLVPLAALAGLVVAAIGGYAALQGPGPAAAVAAAPLPVAQSAPPAAVESDPAVAPTTEADVPRAAAVVAVPADRAVESRAVESRPVRTTAPPAPVAPRTHEAPPPPPAAAAERPTSGPETKPGHRGPDADEPEDGDDRGPGKNRDDDEVDEDEVDADDADEDRSDDEHDSRAGRDDRDDRDSRGRGGSDED